MIAEGDRAPAAPLNDIDGNPVDLAGYRGRPLVIYFYPKADTPGCTNEAKDFSALAGEFAKAGVAILGVSRDAPKKLQKFRDKYGLTVPLGSDESGEFCEAWGTWIEKSLYGRKYMGVARATFLIDKDGTVVKAWPAVKVKGHAEAVLAAARAI